MITREGLELIKKEEGLRLKLYYDVAGFPTIGYGHLVLENEECRFKCGITEEEAEDILIKDIEKAEQAVDDLVLAPLLDNQRDALVSLVFNIGRKAFKNSTILKLLNNRDYEAAAKQFRRWNKAGGKVVKGLANRRERELKLFEGQGNTSDNIKR